MEVVKKEKLVKFKELEQGAYFRYEGKSYIKCEEVCDLNAARLNDGGLVEFSEYNEVEKVNAKIVEE